MHEVAMRKIQHTLYREFPECMSAPPDPKKAPEWLIANGWTAKGKQGDQMTYLDPLTNDVRFESEAVERQSTRPIEDSLSLLLGRLSKGLQEKAATTVVPGTSEQVDALGEELKEIHSRLAQQIAATEKLAAENTNLAAQLAEGQQRESDALAKATSLQAEVARLNSVIESTPAPAPAPAG